MFPLQFLVLANFLSCFSCFYAKAENIFLFHNDECQCNGFGDVFVLKQTDICGMHRMVRTTV